MAKQTDEQDIFTLLEEIEKRKQPAIEGLLKEREEIDKKLARLGYQTIPQTPDLPQGDERKRGRAKGTKMSEEAKAKMREAAQKRWADKKAEAT